MEIFKNTNFDFLGHKWPFIIASLVLSVAGLGSLALKGGPRYGIEFKGGMLLTVKFAAAPPIEKVRSALSAVLSSPPTVQTYENGSNEIVIGTEGADDATLGKNRQLVIDTLAKTFGQPGNGKLDLNNTSGSQLANRLADPLQKAGVQLSLQQVQDLATSVVAWRDQHGGLLTKIDDLRAVPGLTPQVLNVLNTECYPAPYTASRNIEIVGPKVGADLRQQAVQATMLALAGMLVYIWFRFEWIYGVGAVIAVFHDTIITIGVFSILDKEISLTVIAALLTLVGYSMNDTIVIFDRIRENLHLGRGSAKGSDLAEVINRSVNQTLSRTVMTSGLTFLAVLALLLYGGPVLHGFSLALVIGIIIGTYSSVFVASPIVLFWHNWADARKATAVSAAAPAASRAASRPASTQPSGKVKAAK
ncbi:MAG TPA: protein translocase subunit SecF [Bryobacteraceae bacterium]|nr:protein translocase subunit SecF [Bryobacteraceae bacterium]